MTDPWTNRNIELSHCAHPAASLERRGRIGPVPYETTVYFKSRLALRNARRSRKSSEARRSTITIRCCGRLHRVTKIADGPLVFHDHTRDELNALRVLRALGDNGCACLGIAEKIFTAPSWRGDFNDAAKAMKNVREKRAHLPPRFDSSPMRVKRLDKNELRYDSFVEMKRIVEAFVRVSPEYRGIHVEIGFATKTRAPGFYGFAQNATYHATTNEWIESWDRFALAVPIHFMANVRNGTAFIDGRYLAIDFSRVSNDLAEATIIVQREPGLPGRGFKLARVRLTRKGHGEFQQWLGLTRSVDRWTIASLEDIRA
jgi:hypothetical protein